MELLQHFLPLLACKRICEEKAEKNNPPRKSSPVITTETSNISKRQRTAVSTIFKREQRPVNSSRVTEAWS